MDCVLPVQRSIINERGVGITLLPHAMREFATLRVDDKRIAGLAEADAPRPPHKDRDDYSALAPLALIGAAHFSISLFTNLPRDFGVARSFDTTCAPTLASASLTGGVFIACTVSS